MQPRVFTVGARFIPLRTPGSQSSRRRQDGASVCGGGSYFVSAFVVSPTACPSCKRISGAVELQVFQGRGQTMPSPPECPKPPASPQHGCLRQLRPSLGFSEFSHVADIKTLSVPVAF